MALFSVISEIFNVEKCLDLQIRVRGHSRSLKVIPFDHGRRHGFLGGGTKQDSREERAKKKFCTPTFPNVGVQASKYQ